MRFIIIYDDLKRLIQYSKYNTINDIIREESKFARGLQIR